MTIEVLIRRSLPTEPCPGFLKAHVIGSGGRPNGKNLIGSKVKKVSEAKELAKGVLLAPFKIKGHTDFIAKPEFVFRVEDWQATTEEPAAEPAPAAQPQPAATAPVIPFRRQA